MKDKIIKSWYQFAVFIACIVMVILTIGNWNFTQKLILASIAVLHLHFFEEFQFPGGFPWVGMKVELKTVDDDPKKWLLNNASSFWGNEWFAFAVYLLPLFLPKVKFMTLAAMIFSFAELFMHLFFFNISLKKLYNPGLFTTVFGLVPLSIVYLSKAWGTGLYSWIDLVIAIVWIAFNYCMAFRSPIYNALGRKTTYAFSEEEVNRAKPYM